MDPATNVAFAPAFVMKLITIVPVALPGFGL
jgi:hypothetical protein